MATRSTAVADTETPSPLIAATDPRSEVRATAYGNIQMLLSRRSILDQQLSQLTAERRAVSDTVEALESLVVHLDLSISAASVPEESKP